MRGLRKRSLGFTLIEIMMAVGLSSIVMLGVVEMFTYMAKSSKSAQVSTDWASLKMQLTQAIQTNGYVCHMIAAAMGASGINIDSTVTSTNPKKIQTIAYPTSPSGMGGPMNTIATTGQVVNGLQIYSMSLYPVGSSGASSSPTGVPLAGAFGASGASASWTAVPWWVDLHVVAGLAPNLQGTGRPTMFTPFDATFYIWDGPYQADGVTPVPGVNPTIWAGGPGCTP